MGVCRATKANGESCTLPASGPQGLCWAHDPANREKRSRMASKAAKSKKPSRELAGLKAQLVDLTKGVLSGKIETGRAAVANQLTNTRLRTIEVERKVCEAEELEERLGAIERVLKGRPRAL